MRSMLTAQCIGCLIAFQAAVSPQTDAPRIAPPPASAPAPSPASTPSGPATSVPSWVSKDQRAAVEAALKKSATNAPQIQLALSSIEPEWRDDMAWLISTMPEHDLQALTSAFLLTNVRLAEQARKQAPWGKDLPPELFRQYVLPYCSLNERRDDWRKDFMDRFSKKAWEFKDPLDAVKWINDSLPDMLNVHFHATKRKKPDQSPYESMELTWASCTGLSILVVDACRAVGIPARIVGCPAWKTVQGNHNWVEVWWDRWCNVGDSGSDPRGVDWVEERCRTETDPDDWVHAVYAAVWRPTNTKFPLVWAFELEFVPAVNVTRFYSAPVEHEVTLSQPGPADIEVRWGGELLSRTKVAKDAKSTKLSLARGCVFEITATHPDGKQERQTVKP